MKIEEIEREFEIDGVKWRDATNYSQNSKRIPTAWEAKFGRVRVYITSGHQHYRPDWAFQCTEMGLAMTGLPPTVKTKEQAAKAAIETCRLWVNYFRKVFGTLCIIFALLLI